VEWPLEVLLEAVPTRGRALVIKPREAKRAKIKGSREFLRPPTLLQLEGADRQLSRLLLQHQDQPERVLGAVNSLPAILKPFIS
jgi:hypothetical protein